MFRMTGLLDSLISTALARTGVITVTAARNGTVTPVLIAAAAGLGLLARTLARQLYS